MVLLIDHLLVFIVCFSFMRARAKVLIALYNEGVNQRVSHWLPRDVDRSSFLPFFLLSSSIDPY